jgi:hypothetical protein
MKRTNNTYRKCGTELVGQRERSRGVCTDCNREIIEK